jgi:hypothetical protein
MNALSMQHTRQDSKRQSDQPNMNRVPSRTTLLWWRRLCILALTCMTALVLSAFELGSGLATGAREDGSLRPRAAQSLVAGGAVVEGGRQGVFSHSLGYWPWGRASFQAVGEGGRGVHGSRTTTQPDAGVSSAGKLPHSGIDDKQCYAADSHSFHACNEVANALNAHQDGHRSTVNTMSYSKIGFKGETLDDSASSWCAVQDRVTGLFWQNHLSPPSPLTNFGDNSARDASKYAADIGKLCSLSHWRLPTVEELLTIVDYGKAAPGPTLNTLWFMHASGSLYVSSSPYVDSRDEVWFVNFSSGLVASNQRGNYGHVRLVRASR